MDVIIYCLSPVIFFIKSASADEYCPGSTTAKRGFWCRGEGVYCCGTHRGLREDDRYCCCDCTRSLSYTSRGLCTSPRKTDPSCPESLTETVAGIIGGVVITLLILFTLTYICCRKHGFARGKVLSRKNSRVNPARPATRVQQVPGGHAGDAEQDTISPPPYTVDPPLIQPPPYRPRTPRDLLTTSRDILSPPPPYSCGIDPGYPPVECPIPNYGYGYLGPFPLTPGYPVSGTQRQGPVTRRQSLITSGVSVTDTSNMSRGEVMQVANLGPTDYPPMEEYLRNDRVAGTRGHSMDLRSRDSQENTITKY
ncbi:uncharacterized protein LOC135503161 [Lineus longissimus]|uniref:uncharacterized protein LOC135503161 n=1 Tax=Lineus longissimus TaxID=88925 RepID=UPI002B4F58B0